MRHEFIVGEEVGEERLDRWLAAQLRGYSRSRVQHWIEDGSVLINAQTAKPSTRLTPGNQVVIEIPDPRESLKPMEVPLQIIYQDEDLIVVDKQVGLVVHPGAGYGEGTLVQGLLYLKCPLSQGSSPERPGVVHRLDKETSGVILLAKNDIAQQSLTDQFQERQVKKSYLALVHGRFEESMGRIEADIGRDLRHAPHRKIRLHGGKSAITEFEVLKEIEDLSLLLVKPITGRTHQIRVHLAGIDHYVVGDSIYGKKRLDPEGTSRMMLHAWKLRFRHPRTTESLEFTSPLPPEFLAYCAGTSLERCL
ncbi:RluA family pseudouridine synthase [Candidatus Acetothermia bacterium]|nr:RluA family pseudouridine synthase [Candidatus Acetothermia bacterium]MBI3643545.1 RluA family pseudouridine synthase [Candidatus Acetothermia bacterium]